jgi:hypothetical protein
MGRRNLYYNFRGHAINQNLEPLKLSGDDYSQVAYAHFVGEDERQGRSEGGGMRAQPRDRRPRCPSFWAPKCAPERWIDCVVEEEMRM